MRRGLVMLSLLLGCLDGGTRRPASGVPTSTRDATSFLLDALKPWPRGDSTGLLAVTDPSTGRVATYDSALVVLAPLRAGQRDRAARVLRLSEARERPGRCRTSPRVPSRGRSRRAIRSSRPAATAEVCRRGTTSRRARPRVARSSVRGRVRLRTRVERRQRPRLAALTPPCAAASVERPPARPPPDRWASRRCARARLPPRWPRGRLW